MATSAAPSSPSKKAPPANARSTTPSRSGGSEGRAVGSSAPQKSLERSYGCVALKNLRLQLGISLLVGFRRPFRKRCERAVAGFSGLIDQDTVLGRPIAQGIAGLQFQLLADLARNYGLALD